MSATVIRRVRVEKLFGTYTYNVTAKTDRLLILYGDNGSGKTTLLRMLLSLLSPEPHKGHRTVLAGIPFKSIVVELKSGAVVKAERPEAGPGAFRWTLAPHNGPVVSVDVPTDNAGGVSGSAELLQPLTDALETLGLSIHLLADDRRLRETVSHHEPAVVRHYSASEARESEEPGASMVETIVSRFFSWIRTRALRESRAGQITSDRIFLDMLARLAGSTTPLDADPTEDRKALTHQLSELGVQSQRLSEYGLTASIRIFDLERALRGESSGNDRVINEVLRSYIDSMAARLKALQPAYDVVHRVIACLNAFLVHKSVKFDLHRGLTVLLKSGRSLDLENLSSGERQLLIVLCSSATAANNSVFIVDEPEISLNIKWQRKLIQALLDVTQHSESQFVLATHSFEIIAAHSDAVVKLEAE